MDNLNILQITPGAGGMYCGNCFRDNALVAALRRAGHHVLMVPLYLPMRLDEEDQTSGTPVFYGGISVYLEQKVPLFRHAPNWLHKLLATPRLLRWAAGKTAKTRAEDVGDLTISMLRGEAGNQARELEELVGWLKPQPRPDIICLSNAMLVGLARVLKNEMGAPVVCSLQGEDTFLDSLPERTRALAWQTVAQRAAAVDLFIAPSEYFAERMRTRLEIPANKIKVVFNGLNLDGYALPGEPPKTAVLGYFARMCREKGLHLLVDAYVTIRKRGRVPDLKLRVGGGCGPADEPFVREQQELLRAEGLLNDVEFCPNLDRAAKIEFLRSLAVFSVPAHYGEAFGLYLLEALACGVPVVQPHTAAFPEIMKATAGGLLCPPNDTTALANAIEELLLDQAKARALGASGQAAVRDRFAIDAVAGRLVQLYRAIGG